MSKKEYISKKERYVPIAQYAKHYRISRQTVYNMIARGDIQLKFDRFININQKPKLRYERKS